MDGTLLPNTTACLEIARVSNTVTALIDLERRFMDELIDSKQFAHELHVLWSFIDRKLVFDAFAQSPKLDNIQTVMELIARSGGTSCLMTMSPDYYAEHFYNYGVDVIKSSKFPKAVGAQLEFDQILSPADKPVLLDELCRARGFNPIDTVAFGDSGSDIPLFNRLRYTIAVNASPALRSMAAASYDGNDLLEAFELVPQVLRSCRDPGPGLLS
jgi:phosphoserine phosphatase